MIKQERFKGKTIVITGASRGIGKATAIRFGQEGGFVFVGYRENKMAADEVVEMIKKEGGEGFSLEIDVSSLDSVKKAVEQIKNLQNKVDILVNNAGILLRKKLEDYNEELLDQVIEVNEKGVYRLTKEILPLMMSGGVIVNLASSAGEAGTSDPIYGASKAAIAGFTKSLAKNLAPKIRVNAVAPGAVLTDMVLKEPLEWRQWRLAQIPLGKFAEPGDVAEAIVFLASSSAKHITGATLDVNGGYYLR